MIKLNFFINKFVFFFKSKCCHLCLAYYTTREGNGVMSQGIGIHGRGGGCCLGMPPVAQSPITAWGSSQQAALSLARVVTPHVATAFPPTQPSTFPPVRRSTSSPKGVSMDRLPQMLADQELTIRECQPKILRIGTAC